MTWQRGPRSPSERAYIPAERRREVEARDLGICQYCGASATGIDHILAWAQGGGDELENLIESCTVCNSIAGVRVFLGGVPDKRAYIQSRRGELGYDVVSALDMLAAATRKLTISLRAWTPTAEMDAEAAAIRAVRAVIEEGA